MPKLDTKSVGCCVVDNFAVQRQRLFVVHKQQSQLIADPDIRTCRKIANTYSAQTDVAWFANADRLAKAFVFNRECEASIYVVTRELASFMIG